MQLMEAAHQCVGKPYDPAELIGILRRAFHLRDLLGNPQLVRLVGQIRSLPSMPSLCVDLISALQEDQPCPHRIAQIMSQDVAMCAKMLQLVNSAVFGLTRRISNLEEAILYLGLETIKALVLSLQIFSVFEPSEEGGFSLDELWLHSWDTGKLASSIAHAQNMEPPLTDNAFIAGLLHDVGKLVLVSGVPNQFKQALALQHEAQIPSWMAEQTVFGCTPR